VSVRRFFIFFEGAIYEGTQWVMFKPNAKSAAPVHPAEFVIFCIFQNTVEAQT
jgi:phage tail sheath protein FI